MQGAQLQDAVVAVDPERVRCLLDGYRETTGFTDNINETECNLLHELASKSSANKGRLDIAYMLINAGIDLNRVDSSGFVPLHYAVQHGDAELCEVLLQCGADMFIIVSNDCTLYEEVFHAAKSESQVSYQNRSCNVNSKYTSDPLKQRNSGRKMNKFLNENSNNFSMATPNAEDIMNIFNMYKPGLWRAVASENVSDVRRLVNLWCKTDLVKDGKTLRDLAFETGNEAIISLISNITPSMRLVHHVLAEDIHGVKELLGSDLRKYINLEMRKLSHKGAPLLYFVLMKQNVEIVQQLSHHGVCLFTQIRDESGGDMPVFFTALQNDMNPEVILKLMPEKNSSQALCLEKLWYRGLNILHTAIQNSVALHAVSAIIDTVGPALVCQRNHINQTARDMAEELGKTEYVDLIDHFVMKWIHNPDEFPGCREVLLVKGYEHIYIKEDKDSVSDDAQKFIQLMLLYQMQISQLTNAAEEGNLDKFLQYSCFETEGIFIPQLILEGQMKGSGMPILHRAVLHNHPSIVEHIVKSALTCIKPGCKRLIIDDVRDQYRRTALHYACGLANGKEICNILLDAGCSEHTLDKDGKEPVDFREAQGSPAMEELLQKLRNKDFSEPNPDPWEPEALKKHSAFQRRLRFQKYCDQAVHHPHGHMSSCHCHGHSHSHQGAMGPTPYSGQFSTPSNMPWPVPHSQSMYSVPTEITNGRDSWSDDETESTRSSCILL